MVKRTELKVLRVVYDAILMGVWHPFYGWLGYWGEPCARHIPYGLRTAADRVIPHHSYDVRAV